MSFSKTQTVFFKDIQSHTFGGGSNDTDFYRIEFYPGSKILLDSYTEVEFPDYLFLNDEIKLNDEFDSEQPIGLHTTTEFSLSLNLYNFIGDWADVATWILEEGFLDVSFSGDFFYPNNWKIKRVKNNGIQEVIYWGCQIQSGGYNEFQTEKNVIKYNVKTADIIRTVTSQLKINWLVSLIALSGITFHELISTTNKDSIFSAYVWDKNYLGTDYSYLNQTYPATDVAGAMKFVLYSDFFAKVEEIINSYLVLVTRVSGFTFDIDYYPFHFWVLYKQLTDGTLDLGNSISVLSTYLLWSYEIDGVVAEGLQFALENYENVYDMLKMQFESGLQRCSYYYTLAGCGIKSYKILDNTTQSLNTDYVIKDSIKWKDRGGYIGTSTAHIMELGEGDIDSVSFQDYSAINNQNSFETEIAFDNNSISIEKHEKFTGGGLPDLYVGTVKKIKNLGLYDLRVVNDSIFKTIALKLHDYCKVQITDTETVDSNNMSSVTNWYQITTKDKINGYIIDRQLNSGIAYVWAKAIRRLFSQSNMCELEIKLAYDGTQILVGTAINIDLNDLLNVSFLTKYPNFGIVTKCEIDFMKEEISYTILLID